MSCDCYKIDGPFIAEDPDCMIHGTSYEAREYREMKEIIESEHGTFPWAMREMLSGEKIRTRSQRKFGTYYRLSPRHTIEICRAQADGTVHYAEEVFNSADVLAQDWEVVP